MSQPPVVSIITVTFNAQDIVRATIESVLQQTYPHIEYILVDGASKDATFGIIQEYAQAHPERIRHILSEKDRNNYDAMNKGLRLATGDFVWFLHAGDLIPQADTLENALRDYAGEDFIYGQAKILTETGEIRPFHKAHPDAAALSWRSFRNGMIVCHQAMLMRRSICVEYDYENYRIAADLDWTIRCLQRSETGKLRDAGLYLCSFLAGGLSAKHRKEGLKDRFRILRKHFGLLPTLWEHFLIALQALRRGTIGNN